MTEQETFQVYIKEMREFMAGLPQHSQPLSGRIVLTLTSTRYFPGTYVLARMLGVFSPKETLLVYHPPYEQVPSVITNLPNVDSRPIPAIEQEFRQTHPSLALMASGYAQILHIDSDAYPVADITPCWDDLKPHGCIFWQDAPTGDGFRPEVYDLPQSAKETTYTPQGGIFFADMRRVWRGVALAHWFNERYRFYFQYGWGDQISYRAAWELLKLKAKRYTQDRVDSTTKGIFIHQGRDGTTPLFVHRYACKFAMDGVFGGRPLRKWDSLPGEKMAWDFYQQYCGLTN